MRGESVIDNRSVPRSQAKSEGEVSRSQMGNKAIKFADHLKGTGGGLGRPRARGRRDLFPTQAPLAAVAVHMPFKIAPTQYQRPSPRQ